MAVSPTDPVVLLSIATGATGALLLAQAQVQSRMLRRRIADGAGTVAVDRSTGLWSADAAWQCVRAEANRSLRLGRPLDVWVGTADDESQLEERGRELAFALPAGAMGVRLDPTTLALVSCAGTGELPHAVADGLRWRSTSIEPAEDAAASAIAFLRGGAEHG
jgi:hypothetical protein